MKNVKFNTVKNLGFGLMLMAIPTLIGGLKFFLFYIVFSSLIIFIAQGILFFANDLDKLFKNYYIDLPIEDPVPTAESYALFCVLDIVLVFSIVYSCSMLPLLFISFLLAFLFTTSPTIIKYFRLIK